MTVDVDSIMECLGNPTKARILILMKENGPLTPKQILQIDGRLPQATVYRAIRNMEECKVLKVVAETKVKAIVEKTYNVNEELTGQLKDLVVSNNGDVYFRLFAGFAFELMRAFEDYSKRDDIDICNDGSGFIGVPVYATSQEIADLYREICDLLKPYQQRRSPEQMRHTFGVVTTPPKPDVIRNTNTT